MRKPNSVRRPRFHISLGFVLRAAVLGVTLFGAACANSHRPPASPTSASDDENRRRLDAAQSLITQASKTTDANKAIELYDKAVKAYPQIPVAWNNMGILLMKQNRRQEADQAFTTAGEMAPNDPRPLYNRGLNWFENRYPKEARTFFQQALDRDPNYLPAIRGAIEADVLTRQTGEQTLDLLRRALFLERDKKWRERFELQKSRIESYLEVEAEEASRRRTSTSRVGERVTPPVTSDAPKP